MTGEGCGGQTAKKLRLGYTTGSCATLAAKAAAEMLLTGQVRGVSAIVTPKGLPLQVALEDVYLGEDFARCAVRKDAGDDPDITHGALVYARVAKTRDAHISITGGEGVGIVTRKGLDQPVGAAAINSVPRQMIREAVEAICEEAGYEEGLTICISIPGGESLAANTFNPQLGIVGGLSIIGTSGIVEPMSSQALLDTIDTEMSMHEAEGARAIVLTPGNYGEAFLREHPELALWPVVKCSNFIGDALDMALLHGFEAVLLVGHIGKLVKLAGGIMDTHSKIADARMELLALHAALAGAPIPLLKQILDASTTDAALALLQEKALLNPVMEDLTARIEHYMRRRLRQKLTAGALLFSNQYGYLGCSATAKRLLESRKREDKRGKGKE